MDLSKKICGKCKKEKCVTDFYKAKSRKDGYRWSCKECENKSNNARESKYKDTRKKYRKTENYKFIKRRYFLDNKEKLLKDNKKWWNTLNGRLASYKRSAIVRNIDWDLSDEQFKLFWQRECFYCNNQIETIGIDRRDNQIGYSMDNCVSCCEVCNRMKWILGEEEFYSHILKIVKNKKL